MSRNKRSFVKNGIYHISQRSVKGCYAFQKPYDKAILLNLMESVKIGHPFVLLYYAVMDNHAHFLIRVTDGDPSIIFGQIYRKFACYYNDKYNRSGHLFAQRFRASQVIGLTHLLTVLDYIANNPVKAGIVARASDYHWSSHNEILSKQIGYIDKTALLKSIDPDEKRAYRIYQNRIDPPA
jgi:REP element-mobilizing transposase RayT